MAKPPAIMTKARSGLAPTSPPPVRCTTCIKKRNPPSLEPEQRRASRDTGIRTWDPLVPNQVRYPDSLLLPSHFVGASHRLIAPAVAFRRGKPDWRTSNHLKSIRGIS